EGFEDSKILRTEYASEEYYSSKADCLRPKFGPYVVTYAASEGFRHPRGQRFPTFRLRPAHCFRPPLRRGGGSFGFAHQSGHRRLLRIGRGAQRPHASAIAARGRLAIASARVLCASSVASRR